MSQIETVGGADFWPYTVRTDDVPVRADDCSGRSIGFSSAPCVSVYKDARKVQDRCKSKRLNCEM